MANIWDIDKKKDEFLFRLYKAIQSVNLNFLIGSGCSHPALAPLGNVENEIRSRREEGKNEEAERMTFEFLKPIVEVTSRMRQNSDENINQTTMTYKSFLTNISEILFKRKTNILPRQATIFSTNYDLFVEKAFEEIEISARLNDGFNRRPLISGSFLFSPSEFFNSTYNNGNLYNYQVQVPSINLIKIHGSLGWESKDNKIFFSIRQLDVLVEELKKISNTETGEKIKQFNNNFSIVLPREEKFKECILNQTYYDLLRIYANELEKENTLLIAEGFSFADEHIYEITARALRNPTLMVVVFCYKRDELAGYKEKFSAANNVDIVYSEAEEINFDKFNLIIKKMLPPEYKQKQEKTKLIKDEQ